jgi:hypothetical protein
LKSSSSVVEKCLELGGEFCMETFLLEITRKGCLKKVIKSVYGNYVLFKAFKISNITFRLKLVNAIIGISASTPENWLALRANEIIKKFAEING